jgi:LexA-binding, inner membrane-associated putative hydrolase
VFLWFIGMAFLASWLVFRDPALDHRLIVVGALLPDVIDAPTGRAGVAHSLFASAVLLAVVVLATRGRRHLRRSLVALAIGTFLHLLLDGIWTNRQVFLWPFAGTDLGDAQLPSVARGLANVPLELAGLAVLIWAWYRFRLGEPERRRTLLRTGHLGRDLVS